MSRLASLLGFCLLASLLSGCNMPFLGDRAKDLPAKVGDIAKNLPEGVDNLARGALQNLGGGDGNGGLQELLGGEGKGAEDTPRLEGTDGAGAVTVSRPADPHDATIVLVHGLGGDTWNFTLLVQFLKQRGFGRIEMVKLPGNALSMDIPKFASVLGERVDALAAKGEKNVYLVGHSLGGSVLLDYLRTKKSDRLAIPVAVAMASPLKLTLLQTLGAGSMPTDVEFHCMVMAGDRIVRGETAVIDGAHVHRMDPGGISPHMAPVTDAKVMGKLADILEGK